MLIDEQVILMVGAEGGGITLYGKRSATGWRFRQDFVDQTPWMLDEPEIRRESQWLESWGEALRDLDRQAWYRYAVIRVHPEFRDALWVAARERIEESNLPESRRKSLLEKWRQRCGIAPGADY